MAMFDLEEGTERKERGMQRAALRRRKTLELVKEHLRDLALERPDRCVTADDAARFVEEQELRPLGNAAGSLFRGEEWEFTGQWRPSDRVSNHRHLNRVWRLNEAA